MIYAESAHHQQGWVLTATSFDIRHGSEKLKPGDDGGQENAR